jgi:hypothetical protein
MVSIVYAEYIFDYAVLSVIMMLNIIRLSVVMISGLAH